MNMFGGHYGGPPGGHYGGPPGGPHGGPPGGPPGGNLVRVVTTFLLSPHPKGGDGGKQQESKKRGVLDIIGAILERIKYGDP